MSRPSAIFSLPEARRHAQLCADLICEGTMISPHELLIAATALAQGHALATLNQREFARGRSALIALTDSRH